MSELLAEISQNEQRACFSSSLSVEDLIIMDLISKNKFKFKLNDYNKNLFGDSVKFGALQNTKKSIAEVREKREASFAQS